MQITNKLAETKMCSQIFCEQEEKLIKLFTVNYSLSSVKSQNAFLKNLHFTEGEIGERLTNMPNIRQQANGTDRKRTQ